MTDSVQMADITITSKTRAIICFGPATPVTGMRAGDYFQVVIDPEMVSPGGDYIRFMADKECEVLGWQRIAAVTVCEVLEEGAENAMGHTVVMKAITKES